MSTDTAAEPETGSPGSPGTLDVTIVFRSDWGVSTGTGVAGGVDAVVEKDEHNLPVVRGTVLTGAIREQAFIVAEALDGDSADKGKRWREFVGALFGSVRRARLVSFSDARFVSFSDDAAPADNKLNRETVHEVVSLSIDEDTGTAKKDHLRLFERARACILRGTATLLGETLDGRPLHWFEEQKKAAELVLSVSALLVRALGSNRSDGDGLCSVLIGGTGEVGETGGTDERGVDPEKAIREVRERCRQQLEQWDGPAPEAPGAPDGPINAKAGECSDIPVIRKNNLDHRNAADGSGATTFYEADLDIDLTSPVISYDVPFSNELRSLDFLRGTALLPIIHHRLQAAAEKNADVGATAREIIRDAVVNGDLLVSDATAVVNDVRGIPMPLVLSRPKVEGNDETEGVRVLNRLLAGEPEEIHKPLRSGYVFPAPKSADSSEIRGRTGAPALLGRQSTAHNPVTGATGTGQLFLARALPAGMRLRATVTMSERLHEQVKNLLDGAFGPRRTCRTFPERLGLWRLSGTYGRAECRLGEFRPVEVPGLEWDASKPPTLWFTSDVVARSLRLGPGGGLKDLCRAFERAGVPLKLADNSDETRFSAGIRHRRVDSWGAADRRPRATRTVIQAGSVLQVQPADAGNGPEEMMKGLARLSVTGVGELTAQGFGRFVVDHPLLRTEEFRLTSLNHKDFIAEGCAAVKPEEER